MAMRRLVPASFALYCLVGYESMFLVRAFTIASGSVASRCTHRGSSSGRNGSKFHRPRLLAALKQHLSPSVKTWRYDDYRSAFLGLAHKSSLRTSNKTAIIRSAFRLFDRMYQRYVVTEDTTLWPQVEVYNFLLIVLSNSEEKESAKQAVAILQRMMSTTRRLGTRTTDAASTPPPNDDTYTIVMQACLRHGDLKAIRDVFDCIPTPTVQHYNQILRSYVALDVPAKCASDMLEDLLDAHQLQGRCGEGHGTSKKVSVLVNVESFELVCRALSSQANQPAGVKQIHQLISKMESHGFVPSTRIYNELLRALSRYPGESPRVVEEAFLVLHYLVEQSETLSNECDGPALGPNDESFYNIVQILHRSIRSEMGHDCRTSTLERVNDLVNLQNALYEQSRRSDLLPSLRTCVAALCLVSSLSSDEEVANHHIHAILDAMAALPSPSGEPLHVQILKSYASQPGGTKKERQAAVHVIVQVFDHSLRTGDLSEDVGSLLQALLQQALVANSPKGTKANDQV